MLRAGFQAFDQDFCARKTAFIESKRTYPATGTQAGIIRGRKRPYYLG